MKIDGRFWLTKDDKNFLGNGRIELLEKIEKTGSMSAAAKSMKMSYKAAWERIKQINELSDFPIIVKITGGKGGGGTILTPYAYELIATYKKLDKLHRQFIKRFAEAGDDPKRLENILNRMFLTTSARNQLPCKIEHITTDGLNGLVELKLNGNNTLLAKITLNSINSMGLSKFSDVYAIIKSSDINIENEIPIEKKGFNILKGVIKNIVTVQEDAEVSLVLDGGDELIGVLSSKGSKLLKIGTKAYASIDKSHIILGI